ncbi:carboxymuconolactone decarboxylase family protein [Sinomicrobium kalidii]|uniref:carboxymuconolactone decarboxylase family protein n=1 Tax=Sinomicrobium kalidii TaxID=2900738 RepID=UPI001E3979A7|nr:carboxymuconolactone decarboxylase family protein [Sinomicrobium kalidii]UGU17971.1 carboxymuconolactone decarboxylase family protein [Sinomicrobium kalidii]
MKQRLENFSEQGNTVLKAMHGVSKHLNNSTIDKQLLELLRFRVSQINGCAFCLDMHSKELLAKGESAQRLFVLDAWKHAPFFSEKEQAALSWAEAVTRLNDGQVPDDVYKEAARHFTEDELVDLTLAVTSINTFNRFNIAFETPAGTYEVGQFS